MCVWGWARTRGPVAPRAAAEAAAPRAALRERGFTPHPPRADRYRKALDAELASIRRIYEIKDRTFAALWAVFAAAMVGLFGFLSRMMWEFYGDGIVDAVFAADDVLA